jgi:hypothetical protein
MCFLFFKVNQSNIKPDLLKKLFIFLNEIQFITLKMDLTFEYETIASKYSFTNRTELNKSEVWFCS